MKRKNKFVYALLIGCMLMSTACGNTATENETITTESSSVIDEVPSEMSSIMESASSVIGRIQSIDGSTITIATMNVPSEKPGDKGQTPSGDKPADNGQVPSGDKPADNGKAPSGDKPTDNGQVSDGAKPTDMTQMDGVETSEFTISDETVIWDETGNTISLSDLSEGSMVMVELDESGNVLSISVSSM